MVESQSGSIGEVGSILRCFWKEKYFFPKARGRRFDPTWTKHTFLVLPGFEPGPWLIWCLHECQKLESSSIWLWINKYSMTSSFLPADFRPKRPISLLVWEIRSPWQHAFESPNHNKEQKKSKSQRTAYVITTPVKPTGDSLKVKLAKCKSSFVEASFLTKTAFLMHLTAYWP